MLNKKLKSQLSFNHKNHSSDFFKLLIILLSLTHFSNASDFSSIDRHADSAPQSLKKSVPALVEYLVRPAKNDHEKVRAIFRWITQNIDYDADAFINKRLVADTPLKVLERGQAVCGGFANLFKYMCLAAGIKSEVVVGWSKAYGESINRDPNHAWNAVNINQRWYLLDVTWGAGYLDERQRYQRRFDEHYFLTDPDQFIFDHLPEDDLWQLLNRPKSKREFDSLVLLRPAFFQNGLEIVSHDKARIKAYDQLEVTLKAPQNKFITAILKKNGRDIDENYTFIQRSHDRITILNRFPKSGDYILRIFVKEGRDTKEFNWACDYEVEVSNRNIVNQPFARQFAKFIDLDAILYTPFVFRLDKGSVQDFDIRIPGALDVAVMNGKNVKHLKKDRDRFQGKVPLAAGPVRITAKIDQSNEYHWLLEYEAD